MGLARSPVPGGKAWRRSVLGAAFAALAFPAMAQMQMPSDMLGGNATPSALAARGNGNMLLNANQLSYDHKGEVVTATGRVEIYYDGRTVEAHQVTYNRKKERLRAVGRVRITEAGGNVLYADDLEFDKGFRDGFVKALRLQTPDRRSVAAVSARRIDGDKTVFERGVYTACDSCRQNPDKPPGWQVKAEKIVHSQSEKTIEFHNARMEMFGVPILNIPYFWTDDGTVKRKSGFLVPTIGSNNYVGVFVDAPYFWAPAPNYDLLFSAIPYSAQGVLMKARFRHGLENGVYTISLAGIRQFNPSTFVATNPLLEPGNRLWRGSFNTTGQFKVADRWTFGWDYTLASDNTFLRDYSLLKEGQNTVISHVALTGTGERSYFDIRSSRYQTYGTADSNRRYPLTHPTLDYFKTLDAPVMGGELSWAVNAVSLSREWGDYSPRFANSSLCYDRGLTPVADECLLNGIGGTYSRASAEVNWRRRIYDPAGQVWEPFAGLRGDVATYAWRDAATRPDPSYLNGRSGASMARLMPMVGLTYRYPWAARHASGTSIIEPVVQVVARPSESQMGTMPNEDAQSLVFDDSNLFQVSKFSGYDRAEGGGRLNYALQYTFRGDNGASYNAMFGQSVHLFGLNSFAYADPETAGNRLDPAGAGANSGLDSKRSDYVARLGLRPNAFNSYAARMRFDERTFALRRLDLAATLLYRDVSAAAFYTFAGQQPLLGQFRDRQGVGLAGRWQVNDRWAALGGVRYNIGEKRLDSMTFGFNYLDDCLQAGLYYTRDYISTTSLAHNVMFRLSLRTLGEINYGASTQRNY